MFRGEGVKASVAARLREEFRVHFKNITHILDCVACDKCRMWGKLQVHGLATALKVLFSPEHDTNGGPVGSVGPGGSAGTGGSGRGGGDAPRKGEDFKLRRNEIVAFFNAFGKYVPVSRSILKT